MSAHASLVDQRRQQQEQLNRENERFEGTKCRDGIWAVLFVAHLAAVVTIGVMFARKNWSAMLASESLKQKQHDSGFSVDSSTWLLLASVLSASLVSSLMFVVLMRKYTAGLIWFSLLFVPTLFTLFGVYFLFSGNLGGIGFLVGAALFVLFLAIYSNRVPFAVTLLKLASSVVNQFQATILVAVLGVVAQIVWVFVWMLTCFAVVYELSQHNAKGETVGTDSALPWAVFGLILSFFWTAQVIKNLVHTTICGLVAAWFFYFPRNMPRNPTWDSFKRASTTSLGSIALGSLLVAVVEAVYQIVRSARSRDDSSVGSSIVLCCLDCLLNMIRSAMEYMNKFAFVFVAVYGDTFCEGSSKVWGYLQNAKLIWALVNDNLIGTVLFFGALFGGCLTALLAGLLARWVFVQPMWGLWALIGLILGVVITMCVMAVVESAVATLFVCWAEAPDTLQDNQPAVYEEMLEALQTGKQEVDRRASMNGHSASTA